MSLLEKAQDLVGKAKQAAGRITRDRVRRRSDRTRRPREDAPDRISEAARDARTRNRRH